METTVIDTRKTIEALETDFAARLSAGNVTEAVKGFHAPDCRFIPPNAPTVIGQDAIINVLEGMVASGLKNLELTTVEVGGEGNLFWHRGQYVLSLDTPDGTVTDNGSFVTLFAPINGELRCIVDIFNSDIPIDG